MKMPLFFVLIAIGGLLFAAEIAKGAAAQAVAPPPEQLELLGWAPLAAAETIFPNPQSAQAAHLVGKTVVFQMWQPHAKCMTPIVANFYGRIVGDDSNVAFLRYAIEFGGLTEYVSGDVCLPSIPALGTVVHNTPFQSIVRIYGAGAIEPLPPSPAPAPPHPPRLSCAGGTISDPKVRAEYELFLSDPVAHAHLACNLVYRLSGEDQCDALADAIRQIIVATHTDCKIVS